MMICDMNAIDSLPSTVRTHLFTAKEAAKILRCGVGYVHGLCREGKLRHIWLGNKILVTDEAIAEFVKAQSTGGQ